MLQWWPTLQHRTQLRNSNVHVPFVCVMRNTADKHQLQFSNSTDSFYPWHSQPDHRQTRPARMPHAGSESAPSFMSKTLADWVPASYRANRFSRLNEALLHKCLFRTARHSDRSTCTASFRRFHGRVCIPCVSSSASSSGFCLTDPASLGVGAGLQHVRAVMRKHHSEVISGWAQCRSCLNATLAHASDVRTFMPTPNTVDTLQRNVCERLVWTRSFAGLGPVPWRSCTGTSIDTSSA